jgi:hypothetical protein
MAEARRRTKARTRAAPNDRVAAAFASYPAHIRRKLGELRSLIFATAEETDGVGAIEETLKWNEPAYLTSETGSGSTIRLGWKRARPDEYAMYFNCNTNLVSTFRAHFSDELRFAGNRAIVFDASADIPKDVLRICIEAALTYHQRKS